MRSRLMRRRLIESGMGEEVGTEGFVDRRGQLVSLVESSDQDE